MKKILYLIPLIFSFMIISNAKAGSLSIYANKSSVITGNNVIVTVSASNLAGKFSVTSSNSSVLSGGTGGTFIDNSSQTFTFKANSPGTATVTVASIDAADYESGTAYSGSKSITISVVNKPVVTLSSDNNLSSLSVEGKELSQPFDKDTLEYGISLDPDTTSITINAKASDSGATISGAGQVSVQDGDNRLEIVVTAENGSQKTYVINANVKEYDPMIVKVNDKDYTVIRKKTSLQAPNNYQETTVKINETDIPAFKSDITGYTLVGLKDPNGNPGLYVYEDGKYILYKEYSFNKVILYPIDDTSKIPNNYKKYTIKFNDQDITAYKLNESSKYALIYGMNVETGEKHLYMYDAKEDTLQIYNDEEINIIKKQNKLYLKIMIGLASLSLVMIILVIIMAVNKNKIKVKKI